MYTYICILLVQEDCFVCLNVYVIKRIKQPKRNNQRETTKEIVQQYPEQVQTVQKGGTALKTHEGVQYGCKSGTMPTRGYNRF
jgi:hypothetical protein